MTNKSDLERFVRVTPGEISTTPDLSPEQFMAQIAYAQISNSILESRHPLIDRYSAEHTEALAWVLCIFAENKLVCSGQLAGKLLASVIGLEEYPPIYYEQEIAQATLSIHLLPESLAESIAKPPAQNLPSVPRDYPIFFRIPPQIRQS